MELIQFDLTGRGQPDITETVYDSLHGFLIPACSLPWVKMIFQPGHPAHDNYEQMLRLKEQIAAYILREFAGKPIVLVTHSPEEAAQMLRALSGRTHRVMTGFCLYRNGQADTHVEITAVTFRTLSEEEIQAYIATGSPMDKAGAYGIQEQAGIFVRSVEGDYYNVIGLPICPLAVFLRQQGVAVLGTVSS